MMNCNWRDDSGGMTWTCHTNDHDNKQLGSIHYNNAGWWIRVEGRSLQVQRYVNSECAKRALEIQLGVCEVSPD